MDKLLLIFFFFTIVSGILVLLSDNAINAVLCLIGCFINSSIILILCGFDFFALVFVSIYVSVIAVLFLFILMFLNIPYFISNQWYIRLIQLVVILCFFYSFIDYILLPELGVLIYIQPVYYTNIMHFLLYLNSLDLIGTYLYTDFMIYLILAGIILFFAMLGTILLLQQYQFSWNLVFQGRQLNLLDLLYKNYSNSA